MTLTKEKAIRRHRMMWEWITNETLRRHECVDKLEAFKHFGWDPRFVNSMCWCCEYVGYKCYECPVKWPASNGEFSSCMYINKNSLSLCNYGLYILWRHCVKTHDWRTAAYYALYISMLPERK